MHTLKLLLDTTKEEEKFISSVFEAIAQVHNAIVAEGKKRMRMLRRDKRYRYARVHYGETAEQITKIEKRLSQLEKELNECTDAGRQSVLRKTIKDLCSEKSLAEADKKRFASELSEAMVRCSISKKEMERFATSLNKRYKGLLGSQQIQVEADRVWAGMEKVLFGNGRDIHYKKSCDFRTVRGKQNTTGIRFDKNTLSVLWLKHTIPVSYKTKLDKAAAEGTDSKDLLYKMNSLSAGDIRYAEIVREEFLDGYHYYVNLYIEGDAPKKLIPGTGRCGIDPGVSTLAATSEKKLFLEELAPDFRKYEKAIFRFQKKADRIRRRLNPQNYNEDGTIRRRKPGEKRIWYTNPTYERHMQQIRVLYRKKAAYIRQSHSELCNRLLASADTFLVEGMDFQALAKRAKETRRADKTSVVTMADGTKKEVYKYKKKKRFGRSINSRAPAMLLEILQRKCRQYGLKLWTTNAWKMKASQYDHTSGTCTKHALKDRLLTLSDGSFVQRDLYSSFLQQHADETLEHPDRNGCLRDFSSFKKRQDTLLAEMKTDGVSMKQCFGF